MIDLPLRKFKDSVLRDGLRRALTGGFRWLLLRAGIGATGSILQRRLSLSKKLLREFDGVVRYGPFKGMRFSRDSWWGRADRAAMLLGIYEQEVIESLSRVPHSYTTFVDLGAADGYYGVGVLVGKIFRRSIVYEISSAGRAAIADNARVNDVCSRVLIKGRASKDFFADIPAQDRNACVVLIDIEGAEFELLNSDAFFALKDAIIFIELHDWFFSDARERRAELEKLAMATHDITVLRTGARDPSKFAELNDWLDDDRWLICSEGRGRLMTWLRLDPRRL